MVPCTPETCHGHLRGNIVIAPLFYHSKTAEVMEWIPWDEA